MDVSGVNGPGVPQHHSVLHYSHRVLVQVGYTGESRICVTIRAISRQITQRKVGYRLSPGNMVRHNLRDGLWSYVPVKDSCPTGSLDVHQRFSETKAQASDPAHLGGNSVLLQRSFDGCDNVVASGGLTAQGRANSDPRLATNGQFFPTPLAFFSNLFEIRHSVLTTMWRFLPWRNPE